jgi:hypothetical protein
MQGALGAGLHLSRDVLAPVAADLSGALQIFRLQLQAYCLATCTQHTISAGFVKQANIKRGKGGNSLWCQHDARSMGLVRL